MCASVCDIPVESRSKQLFDHFIVHRKRGKKGEKNGKGLRHFSMKVCEKVQKKGVTTYNEVADELVAEFSAADNHISPNDSVSTEAICTHCIGLYLRAGRGGIYDIPFSQVEFSIMTSHILSD